MIRTHERTQSIRAITMTLVMVLSVVAIGGVAAQPAGAQVQNNIPAQGQLGSDEYLVDDDYAVGENTDNDALYRTISAALANPDADTIYVAEGDYNESLDVDQQVKLIGAGREDVTVDSTGDVELNITADHVLVDGFTFDGSQDSMDTVVVGSALPDDGTENLTFTDNRVIAGPDSDGFYHGPMDQDGEHVETLIQDNTFTVATPDDPESPIAADYLLHVDKGDGVIPHNITIDDNTFTSPKHKGVPVGYVATSLYLQADDSSVTNNMFDARADTSDGVGGSESAQVWNDGDGNHIAHNHVYANWAEYGIAADQDGGSNLTVTDNKVTQAQQVGIIVSEYDDVLIDENQVNYNHGPGVLVGGSMGVDVLENDVKHNNVTGVGLLDVDNASVGYNYISHTVNESQGLGPVGLYLDNVTDGDVYSNVIEDNGDGAEIAGNSKDLMLRKNRFVYNAKWGINVTNYDTSVDEERYPKANYNDFSKQSWDIKNHVDAPFEGVLNWFGTDSPDIADKANVAGNVIYDPFLTDDPNDVVRQKIKTQSFAHDFVLQESTGPVHTVAFPGPVDRSVGEVFADLPAGAGLFAYDPTSGWTVPQANDSISSLEAFVVTDLPEGETVTLVAGYTNDGAASPGQHALGDGWNLLGAPMKDDVEDAFARSGTEEQSAVNYMEGPHSQPRFLNGVNASGSPKSWGHVFGQSADKCVSPYTGYWVKIDGDGTDSLGSRVPAGTTYDSEIGLLQTDHSCDNLKNQPFSQSPS